MRISDWSSDVCSSDLALRTQRRNQCFEFVRAVSELQANEHMRLATIGIAVIEFGDDALANLTQELFVRTRLLRQRHREQRLGVITQFGALGDVAQAIEVDVRSEERRVGQGCVSTSSAWWSPDH